MFVIARWGCAGSGRLLLTRDRAAASSRFHYSQHRGNLYFGSEVKCILAADEAQRARRILAGIDQLLTLEYTASPVTLFKDVHKLPPRLADRDRMD